MDKHYLIDRYLTWLGQTCGRAETTIEHYGHNLRRMAAWLGDRDITRVSLKDLEEFTGPELHRLGLRPSSRQPAVAAIRGFYAWAAKRGLIAENPAAELPVPKAGRPLPRIVTLQEAERLLMAPGMGDFLSVRDTAVLSVLIGCGPRASGVRFLNEGDLLWTREDGAKLEQLYIVFREKGKSERVVPAPHETALLIRAYLGHPDLDLIDRTLPNGDRVLFVNLVNSTIKAHEHYGEKRRLSRWAIKAIVKRWATVAGLPPGKRHPHVLRHLYGTELAENDVGHVQRMRLMGHATPQTVEIYDHTAMRKLTDIVRRSNPLKGMKTPASDLVRQLSR